MNTHKIIAEQCRLYGVSMPEIDYSQTQFFVTISSSGASVIYLREPSVLIGRIIGNSMKLGTVLHVRNGWTKTLTWENWKKTWAKLFEQKATDRKPEPNKVRPYKSEIFDTMKQPRSHKKPQKRGFERTFTANRALDLLSAGTTDIKVVYT